MDHLSQSYQAVIKRLATFMFTLSLDPPHSRIKFATTQANWTLSNKEAASLSRSSLSCSSDISVNFTDQAP